MPNFTYAAYDAGLPCRNPHCKSYGLPHPNCRCYGGMPESPASATQMVRNGRWGRKFEDNYTYNRGGDFETEPGSSYAEGGEVKHYCQLCQPHKEDCEYFQEGGEAGNVPIVPDSPAPQEEQIEQPQAEQPQAEQPEEEIPVVPDYSTPASNPNVEPGSIPIVGEGGTSSHPELFSPLAALEGLASGVVTKAPVTAFELGLNKLGVPGMSPEEIHARGHDYPLTQGLFEIGGLAATQVLLDAIVPETAPFQTMQAIARGKSILGTMALNAGFGVSQTASDYLLERGDPGDAAITAMINGGIGAALGLLPSASSWARKKAVAEGVSGKMKSLMTGLADGSLLITGTNKTPKIAEKMLEQIADISLSKWDNTSMALYKKGRDLLKTAPQEFTALMGKLGFTTGVHNTPYGIGGIPAEKAAKFLSEKIAEPVGLFFNKHVINATLRHLDNLSGYDWMQGAATHAEHLIRGENMITKSIDNLFSAPLRTLLHVPTEQSKADKEKLKGLIDEGGVNEAIKQHDEQQDEDIPVLGYADGGEVKASKPKVHNLLGSDPGVEKAYPAQAMAMATIKGRMVNYLHGLKPQENHPKLAFDDAPKHEDVHKAYERALELAVNPMSILDDVRRGTVRQDDLHHIQNMYPELINVLKNKATEEFSRLR